MLALSRGVRGHPPLENIYIYIYFFFWGGGGGGGGSSPLPSIG